MAMKTRILVVDDDPSVTSLLRRGLSYEGYEVQVASSGTEGLALARETPPSLVILDVMMPGIDGFEVCRRLRAGRYRPPDSHAHRPGCRHRPGAGARERGGRLRGQALHLRCAAGSHPGQAAPEREPGRRGDPRLRRPHPGHRHSHGAGAGRGRSTSPPPSTACCWSSCATPARCSPRAS